MPERHGGEVALTHSFARTHRWLQVNGPRRVRTEVGTRFEARAATTTRGRHEGEAVIRFFQSRKEYGRAYECCWGRYHNCNGTRIGMYCEALDREVGRFAEELAMGDRETEARVGELLRTRLLVSDLLSRIDSRLGELGYEPSLGRRRHSVPRETSMKRSRTVSGKPFYYDGSISAGLTVYPTDRDGVKRSGSQVAIRLQEVAFIQGQIRRVGEIPMGACRDNPVSGSLGEKLRQRRKSPQLLSYVIPLLTEEGFCTYFKRGRRYIIRYNRPGDK